MKKKLSVLAVASIFAAGSAFASGYRIPEQSIDSTAKAGANIASATNADATYFNPANMSWIDEGWLTELDLTYIRLASISYDDVRSPFFSGSTEDENFLLPTFFVVSPNYNNFRFGLSLTAPFGLAKRWNDPYPATFAKKFSLQVFELNPTVSYKFNQYVSVAGGARMLMAKAIARNGGVVNPAAGIAVDRDLEGNWEIDWGYNLALSVKPTQESNLSITYRSNVDLGLTGDATLSTNFPAPFVFKSDGNVTLPAPGVLSLSGSYTWDKLTVELTWDRTFWSEYEALDIKYADPLLQPVLASVFGPPVPKNWDDTDAFRIGVSYEFNEMFTGMAGFGIDNNPVPSQNLSFELPDTDALLFAIGGRYKVSEQMELGLSFLYDYKDDRTVTNGTVNGKFTDAAAILVTGGLSYKF
ncbi:MAG: aromatic hydrocarbon degradation protein [Desulfobacterales bacterium]|nr:aromatic hydrocarbon degradation protein [Desulfobacterales bacterium]